MLLICPQCKAKLYILDERLPKAGAWSRCPKCEARFFSRHPEPENAPETEKPKTSSSKKELIRGLTSLEGPPSTLGQVMIFPEPAVRYTPYIAALAVVGLFTLGAFIHAMINLTTGPAARKYQPPRLVIGQYTLETSKVDLRTLNQKFRNEKTANYEITFNGPERRIFDFYLERLSPGRCPAAENLRLHSADVTKGFTITGTCKPDGTETRQASLNLAWRGFTAQISVEGEQKEVSVELYSQKPRKSQLKQPK